MQQITRARPLVAIGGFSCRPRPPREPGPAQHLPDRRVRAPGRRPDQPRPPTCPTSTCTDPLLHFGSELAWRALRPTRAITQTRQRPPLLVTRLAPALPPPVRCRRRNAETSSSLPQRAAILDRANQREPTSQSELGISVQIHPSPP